MSETEAIIINNREDVKSEMVSRQVFPPLSSRKQPPPYDPEKYDLETLVQNNDVNPSGLEDFKKDIPRDFSAGYVSDDTDDESVFGFQSDDLEDFLIDIPGDFSALHVSDDTDDESPDDPGPCYICHGPHSELYCQGLDVCPIDLEVGEPYEVICLCGSVLNNGKCSDGCDKNLGRVIDKSEAFKYF
ncbi:hypothetical protein CASFOL_019722 [Castilleja foliolosa]|uniref:Uncharacterized protein n=1 Tax=Castilleja foliolosa TaxID=1961234 RepID=A0ABD3CYU5_9LAMI